MVKFLLLFIITSCSVNQLSKDYYDYKKELRHGLIPIAKGTKGPYKSIDRALNPKNISIGREIYVKNCLMCHGKDGKGNGPKADNFFPKPKDLTALSQEVPNFKFYLSVSKWQETMPGWVSPLTEEDISYIEVYLKSLNKKG